MQADVKMQKNWLVPYGIDKEDYELQILAAKIELHFITLLPKFDSILIK